MKMTNGEYNDYIRRRQPRSPLWRDVLRAYVAGGAICAAGQGILALYSLLGLSRTDAATACSITLVFLGAALTGLGVYDDAARFAGAGTLVPITGFANAMAAPALEFKRETLLSGTCTRMFTIAGPVIVCGISASIVYGLLLLIWQAV